MAPVIAELQKHPNDVRSVVCSVGQHREMLHQVLDLFGIVPDYDLNLMEPDQALPQLTSKLFTAMDRVASEVRPDWMLAQGDTTTVFVAAMTAFYHHVSFGHVEAGLRTGDKRQPFPEEINRRIAGLIAEVHFAPTACARDALLAEGCAERDIYVTGNTGIDALYDVAERDCSWDSGVLSTIPRDRRLVLITAHRRESFGAPFREVCLAIQDLARSCADDRVHFVFPVHLNPNVRKPVMEILSRLDNVSLIEPLDYLSLVHVMKRSVLVLTDSGGIQEEALAFRLPVLVMRHLTERPEGLSTGLVTVVGTDRHRIVAEAAKLLDRSPQPASTELRDNPHGGGRAANRIVSVLRQRSLGRGTEGRATRIATRERSFDMTAALTSASAHAFAAPPFD